MFYLLFGGFSLVSWVLQLSKGPGRLAVWVSYVFNFAAVLALLAVVVFQVRRFPVRVFDGRELTERTGHWSGKQLVLLQDERLEQAIAGRLHGL